MVVTVPSEDSDSGLSSAASVGTSQCNIGPSHASSSSSQNFAQMVPHVHTNNPQFSTHVEFSQALITPHVDASLMALDLPDISMEPAHQVNTLAFILGPRGATSQHKWKKSTQLQAICQLWDKNKVQHIPTKSVDYSPLHSSINDPMCFPLLSAYSHQNIPHLVPTRQDPTSTIIPPVFETNQGSAIFFNQFLSSWALNNNNPNLFEPPPPFLISSYPTTSHLNFMQLIKAHIAHPTSIPFLSQNSPSPSSFSSATQPLSPTILKLNTSNISTPRKTQFHNHRPSRFMTYAHDWKPHFASVLKSQPSTFAPGPSPLIPTSSANTPPPANISPTNVTPLETPYTTDSPPEKLPYTCPIIVPVESSPCMVSHSKGKGKMKWIDDEDDIPLAQLKKSRHEDTTSLDSLSSLEIAAYSLTQLQHATPSSGPVHNFMEKPLQDFQGRLIGFLPQLVAFASKPFAALD
ncbi:hypothetical protein FH972_015359 [Carpinus fangiana]|uniref:Uncharacterized protein n=1 Tax=Carpinus fangiana TaxID=176857 RepID=A0A5N6RFA2_9ROSI|nr:hypothetical protein FH972_015359 [Carpinus fangiana]